MRFLPGSDGGPGSWLLSGPSVPAAAGRVWDHIAHALSQQPAAACLQCGDTVLTRADTDAQVRRIADRLHGMETSGARIGIHVSRSLASVIATLAAWRSGAAYVPLPTELPPARAELMARRCDLDLVVSDTPASLDGYVPAGEDVSLDRPLHFLRRDGFLRHDGRPGHAVAGGIAYIAHTSGSTGTPKGVLVGDAALRNRLGSMQRLFAAAPQDRFLYKTSAVFDVHVWEFALPLVVGGLCVIYPQGRQFDLFAVAQLLSRRGITIVGLVPNLLNALLEMRRLSDIPTLRAVLCGGESWPPRLAEKFYAQLPRCGLYNSYGPAETTIAVANWPVPRDPLADRILLGAPLDNLHFLVEERSRSTAARGEVVTGMLSIGGTQVADGYVDPADNEGAFYVRPIDGEPVRWFCTGDLVRLETDGGRLSFLGREDTQVKVNGVRIELEEIESVIAAIDNIEGCVVVVSRDGPAPQLWAAFAAADGVALPAEAVRAACERVLPRAYVPAAFMQVAGFPLRPSGKIDRAAVLHALQSQRGA